MLIIAFLSALAVAATANTSPSCTTCYSVTSTAYLPCPYFDTSTCIRPFCILLKTTVIPSKTCRKTATYTQPCVTACPGGCATTTETITAKERCVPTSPSSCYTSTTTSGIIFCPKQTPCPTRRQTVTVTHPGPNPYCAFTPTETVGPTCNNGCTVTKTKSVA